LYFVGAYLKGISVICYTELSIDIPAEFERHHCQVIEELGS